MKIGNIDIKRAYLGHTELTENNAYLGTTKLINSNNKNNSESNK